MTDNSRLLGLSLVNNQLLMQLVLDLKGGNIRRCENYGLSRETIQLLMELTIEEVMYLTNSPVSVLDININEETLQRLIGQARVDEQRQQRITRAIVLGASVGLLSHYFGLASTEVASRRRIAGVEIRSGRLNAMDDETAGRLWHEWSRSGVDNPDSPEALDAMMLIAESLDLSISHIWNALREWHHVAPARAQFTRGSNAADIN